MKWLGNCFFFSNRRIFEIEAYSRGRERVPVGNIRQNPKVTRHRASKLGFRIGIGQNEMANVKLNKKRKPNN